MGIISLEGLEFFSYHGFYAEEQRMGNRYAVDVSLRADLTQAAQDDKLSETIDYEKIYQLIAAVMAEQHRLLEHIAWAIIRQIRQRYPSVESIRVAVSKFNPPVGGVCERARVTLEG